MVRFWMDNTNKCPGAYKSLAYFCIMVNLALNNTPAEMCSERTNPALLIVVDRKYLLVSSLILMIVSLCIGTIQAKDHTFICNRISRTEGLMGTSVNSIVEGANNVFWVGTNKGLNRIIGGKVNAFYSLLPDSVASQDNKVQRIIEDENGKIWVLSQWGTFCYDLSTDRFVPVSYFGKPLSIISIEQVKDGLILGGKGVLYKYTYADESLTVLYEMPMDKKIRMDNLLQLDEHHLLIISYFDGVYLFDYRNRRLSNVFQSAHKINARGSLVDSKGYVWIPIFNDGLVKAKYEHGTLGSWQHYTHQNLSLDNISVLSLLEVEDGNLWLSTDGAGIWTYSPDTNVFEKKADLREINSTLLSSVNCLYKDRNSNIWGGTIHGGIVVLKEVDYKFTDVNDQYYVIGTMFYDRLSQGKIWVGMDSGGLYEYDIHHRRFTNIETLSSKKVMSIIRYSPHELLFAAYDDGLYLLDVVNYSLKPFPIKDRQIHKELFASQRFVNIVRVGDTIKLISSAYIYQLENDTLVQTYKKISEKTSISSTDGSDSRWFIVDSSRKIVDLFDADEPYKVIYQAENSISAATVASNKNIFFVENFVLKQIEGETVSTICSLPFSVEYMVCDMSDRIWIFTSEGVFCYELKTGVLCAAELYANAANSAFSCQAALCDQTGNVYWGGIENFCKINTDIALKQNTSAVISVVSLTIDKKITEITGTLSLPYDFTVMDILFAVRDKDVFSENKDVFILEGVNEIVLQAIDNKLQIYTLPSGEYNLKYCTLDSNGKYTSRGTVLEFEVGKPWWLSGWSVACYALIILIVIYMIIRYQDKKRRREIFWSLKEYEKEMSDEKVRFLINISHELRTPLTLIYTPLKDILQVSAFSEKEHAKLQRVFLQVRNMFNLINMVLDTRKIEVSGENLIVQETELNAWVREVCDDFQLELEAANIVLSFELDENIQSINFDRNKCKIILSNFIMNALKYASGGNLICVKTEFRERFVRISVMDNGVGIQEDKIDRLFDRFYQGKQDMNGFGIGLSYAKTLVRMHKGVIGAYNNEERGATFYFELPIGLSESSLSKADPLFNKEIKIDYQSILDANEILVDKYSVLVVDDEKEILDLLSEKLKPDFKHVYCASDGKKALELIKNKMPDIVVSDVMMPVMDGYELCRTVKTDLEIGHIPIILLTARADVSSFELGYKMGADNYIAKPFDVESLRTVVLSELCNREIVRARYKNAGVTVVPESVTISNADETFVLSLNKYIEENLSNESLNLNNIAMHLGVSRSLLHMKMKAILGTNVSNYINDTRINKAKQLLANKDLPLGQIAFETGFSTQSYFSTVFKKSTGMTPQSYRKQLVQ